MFSSVNDRLIAYRADNGEKLAKIQLGTIQMGPPISFTIDGKQYIAITAAQVTSVGAWVGGGHGGAGGGASAAPTRPANLLVLALDGKATLPGTAPVN